MKKIKFCVNRKRLALQIFQLHSFNQKSLDTKNILRTFLNVCLLLQVATMERLQKKKILVYSSAHREKKTLIAFISRKNFMMMAYLYRVPFRQGNKVWTCGFFQRVQWAFAQKILPQFFELSKIDSVKEFQRKNFLIFERFR